MKLDEAIKHCEEVAEEKEKAAKEWHENQVRKCKLIRGVKMDYTHENECKKCAEEHRQLAEWLKELKQLREQTRWIPVSERLPELSEDVLGIDSCNELIQAYICDDCGEIKWVSDRGYDTPIVAWMPLPEPYKTESEIN